MIEIENKSLIPLNKSNDNNNNNNNNENQQLSSSSICYLDNNQQQQQKRKYPNYYNYIKRSSLNKGSFEINGRHNECISCKNNVFYVKNLKFPDCVVRNLCQINKYQGESWFINHSIKNNDVVVDNENNEINNENHIDDCYETIYEKIHVELNDFYSFIKPLKEDDILRKATFFCIANSIKKLSFVRLVKYYGSYSSKTYLPVSDIDIVVHCTLYINESNTLFKIGEQLSYDGLIENQFNIIPLSRIPLLKFNDSLTGLPINITLNTPYVMERSRYIRENIQINSYQMKILLFLKYYLLSKGTNQVYYGGIGSYSLSLMVIRFFQEESVRELLRNEQTYEKSILGYLLMSFFERFGDVNFFKNHIISVEHDGEYIECDYINNGGNFNSGNGGSDNFKNKQQQPNEKKKISILRIKDHIEPWNDVSYGSFNSAEILKDFQYLYDKFMKSDRTKSKSILGQVLFVVDSFIEYRNLLLYLYRKWFNNDFNKLNMNSNSNEDQTNNDKYQEFIKKRSIFKKKQLFFQQTNFEDKSIEYRFESIDINDNDVEDIDIDIDIDIDVNNENINNNINNNNNNYNSNNNRQLTTINQQRSFNNYRFNNQNRQHFHHHHHHNNILINQFDRSHQRFRHNNNNNNQQSMMLNNRKQQQPHNKRFNNNNNNKPGYTNFVINDGLYQQQQQQHQHQHQRQNHYDNQQQQHDHQIMMAMMMMMDLKQQQSNVEKHPQQFLFKKNQLNDNEEYYSTTATTNSIPIKTSSNNSTNSTSASSTLTESSFVCSSHDGDYDDDDDDDD